MVVNWNTLIIECRMLFIMEKHIVIVHFPKRNSTRIEEKDKEIKRKWGKTHQHLCYSCHAPPPVFFFFIKTYIYLMLCELEYISMLSMLFVYASWNNFLS